MPDKLLTVHELATYLRISKSSLDKYRLTGDGPKYIRVGRHAVRYRMSDVEAYLASRVTTSTSVTLDAAE